jgi:hypothetical protein
MKQLLALCITIMLAGSLISCEDPLFAPVVLPFAYDGELIWTQEPEPAGFSPRYDHASVVYDGAMWIIGGYDPTVRGTEDSYKEDLWKSEDGTSWELVTDDSPLKGRRGHAAVLFEDKILIAGGFAVDEATGERSYCDDVWTYSTDKDWEQLTADAGWIPRMNHSLIAVDDTLYLFGGFYDGRYYCDDMYKSTDGSTWDLVVDGYSEPVLLPGARASFASCLAGDGKIYLQGGSYYDAVGSNGGTIDPSVDHWQGLWVFDPADESAGWEVGANPSGNATRRAEHELAVFGERLWMLSGKANTSLHFSRYHELYSTQVYDDSWSEDSPGSGFGPRYSYTTEVFSPTGCDEDRLYILGGFTDSGAVNDIIYATMGGE